MFDQNILSIMNDSKHKAWALLLKRAQNGDAIALQSLCQQLEKYIRGFFQKKFQDKNIIDDLCQETYLRLLNYLSTIRAEITLQSYVAQVAFHVMQDYLREKYHKKERSLEKKANDFANEKPKKNLTATIELPDEPGLLTKLDLEKAMRKLPDKARQILILKLQGFEYKEISADLGFSESDIKMQVKRSIDRLKYLLFFVTFFLLKTSSLIEQTLKNYFTLN